MVYMAAKLHIVLSGLLVASLGGCGDGSSKAASPPDALRPRAHRQLCRSWWGSGRSRGWRRNWRPVVPRLPARHHLSVFPAPASPARALLARPAPRRAPRRVRSRRACAWTRAQQLLRRCRTRGRPLPAKRGLKVVRSTPEVGGEADVVSPLPIVVLSSFSSCFYRSQMVEVMKAARTAAGIPAWATGTISCYTGCTVESALAMVSGKETIITAYPDSAFDANAEGYCLSNVDDYAASGARSIAMGCASPMRQLAWTCAPLGDCFSVCILRQVHSNNFA